MNLLPVVQMVKDLAQKKKDEEKLNNFLGAMEKFRDKANTIYNPTGVNNATWEQGNNILPKLSQLTGPPEVKQDMGGDPADSNLAQQLIKEQGLTPTGPKPPDVQMNEQPSDMILGDVKTGEPEQTAQMNKDAQKEMFNTLLQMIEQGTDPSRIQQGGGLLSQLIKSEQPPPQKKPDIYNLSPGQKRFSTKDGETELVAENIKQKDEKPVEQLIFEDGNERVYGYESEKGTREYNGKKYVVTKETDKKKDKPEKEEEEPDVARTVGNIRMNLAKIKKGKLSEEESNELMDYVIGDTDELIDKYGLINEVNWIWRKLEGGKIPSSEVVKRLGEYLKEKGQDPLTVREKNYIELYFKARKFKKPEKEKVSE